MSHISLHCWLGGASEGKVSLQCWLGGASEGKISLQCWLGGASEGKVSLQCWLGGASEGKISLSCVGVNQNTYLLFANVHIYGCWYVVVASRVVSVSMCHLTTTDAWEEGLMD